MLKLDQIRVPSFHVVWTPFQSSFYLKNLDVVPNSVIRMGHPKFLINSNIIGSELFCSPLVNVISEINMNL